MFQAPSCTNPPVQRDLFTRRKSMALTLRSKWRVATQWDRDLLMVINVGRIGELSKEFAGAKNTIVHTIAVVQITIRDVISHFFFFQIKYHRLLENCRISWGNAHKAEQMGYPVSQIICSSCFRSGTNCSMFWHPRLYYNYIYIYTPSLFIFWFVVNLIQIFERRQLHTTVESPRLRGRYGEI